MRAAQQVQHLVPLGECTYRTQPTARATVATVAGGLEEGRRDICPVTDVAREITDDDISAERAQGIGTLVVVVYRRSHGPAALSQQRHNLAAPAADSPAGASHQDETRLSHPPPPCKLPS